MLHPHRKPRLKPLYILRGLERSPRRREPLDLSEKLSAFLSTKRDECRPGVFQPIAVCEYCVIPDLLAGTIFLQSGSA